MGEKKEKKNLLVKCTKLIKSRRRRRKSEGVVGGWVVNGRFSSRVGGWGMRVDLIWIFD